MAGDALQLGDAARGCPSPAPGCDPRCRAAARPTGRRRASSTARRGSPSARRAESPAATSSARRSSRCPCGGSRWSCRRPTIVSPESCSTRRSTPCVLGCCGPMLTVIVSLRSSGIESVPVPAPSYVALGSHWQLELDWHSRSVRTARASASGGLPARARVLSSGTFTWISAACPTRPPSRPVKRNRLQPARRAACSAATTLADIAARRNPERHVAGLPERFDLPREHLLERVVVRDARQHAGVGRQRDRRPAPGVPAETGRPAPPPGAARRRRCRRCRTPAASVRACSASSIACAATSAGPRLPRMPLVQRDGRRRTTCPPGAPDRRRHRRPLLPLRPFRASAGSPRTPRRSAAAARTPSAVIVICTG